MKPPFILIALALGLMAQNLLTPSLPLFLGALLLLVALAGFLFSPLRFSALSRSTYLLVGLMALAALVVASGPAYPVWTNYLVAALLYILAAYLFVRETPPPRCLAASPRPSIFVISPRRVDILAVVLSALLTFTLAAYDIEHIPPGLHGDEAESALEGVRLLRGSAELFSVGWYDLPMASFLLHAWGMRVFGEGIFGLRIVSALVGALIAPATYLLARQMFDRRVALVTLALMVTAHWFIAFNRLGINYNQTTLLQVMAFYFFLRAVREHRLRDYSASGFFTGLGFYGYFASRLVPGILLAYVGYLILRGYLETEALLRPRPPSNGIQRLLQMEVGLKPTWTCLSGLCQLTRRDVLGLGTWLVVAVVIFAPMLAYFADHPNEFLTRTRMVFIFSNAIYIEGQSYSQFFYGTTDPLQVLAIQIGKYVALFNQGPDRSGQYGYAGSLLEYLTAILFVLGLAHATARWREPRYAFLLIWFGATLVVGGILTIEAPFTPRLVGMMPAAFILAALALDRVWQAVGPPTLARGKAFAVALIIVTCGAIALDNVIGYFDIYIHSVQGWAQREPATAVARYIASLDRDVRVYLYGEPFLYLHHGTIRFLTRGEPPGEDISNPAAQIPVRDPYVGRAAFILLPHRREWLDTLRAYYPRGLARDHIRPADGALWFTTYEVSADSGISNQPSGISSQPSGDN